MNFFDTNEIIIKNHHGSRPKHGTDTALATIQHNLTTNYYANNYTAMIQTDLSAAFDMVDHSILLDKLEFYGVRGKELEIVRSFLSGRKQYISIEGRESELIDSLGCSVVQGSKLSSYFYIIYTNEIPLLHKLINSDLYFNLTGDILNSNYSTIKKHGYSVCR